MNDIDIFAVISIGVILGAVLGIIVIILSEIFVGNTAKEIKKK
jgi:hypothetical protein